MQELDDNTLLRQYVERNSEEAFATLVARHINKVYSVALRQTNNPNSAEEITQAVFVILATKAKQLQQHPMLSGWLYQTARLTATTFIRGEIRRSRREQEAYMQNVLDESAPEVWPQIAPLLESAMAHLNDIDRHAVVLRFFDGKSMDEVGRAMNSTEEAAKKRVNRAVEKLQKFFFKHGVNSSATAITESISVHSVQAAPALLAKTITAVALSNGAAVSTSTLTLIKGALKVMAWTKMKTGIVVGIAVLCVGGAVIAPLTMHRQFKPVTVQAASLKFAGYQTPEASMQSVLFAITQANREMYMASLAPGGEFYRDMQTMPDKKWSEIRRQSEGGITGMTILDKKIISADTIALTVRAEGINQTGHFQFRRVGTEWKFDGAAKN